jgi:cell division protein FtsB
MLLWILLLLVILVGLTIPILSIVLDSPIAHRLFESRQPIEPRVIAELTAKIERLEAEVDDLNRSVEALREENEFVQRLLEDLNQSTQRPLPPPDQ